MESDIRSVSEPPVHQPVPKTIPEVSSKPVVKHFRQIVLWPLQLVMDKTKRSGDANHKILEKIAPQGPWFALDDEFGCAEDDFKERHYREFVSFLPPVQRFLYGDATMPGRKPLAGETPMRIYRRTDIHKVRVRLDESSSPLLLNVAHTDLYFFYDVDAIILVSEIYADNLPLEAAVALTQRFGRAYPAGWSDHGDPVNCAHTVEWLGEQDRVLSISDYGDRNRYLRFVGGHRATCVSKHWEFLLHPIVNDACGQPGPLRFREIEYNRMPTMAYLAVDDLKSLKKADYISLAFATTFNSEKRLPFADRFVKRFENQHVYDRLYSSGLDVPDIDTRFLTSGDVFTIVAGGCSPSLVDNERGLLGQFRHQYFLLFLVAHFHKASLLMISDRTAAAIKNLNPIEPKSIRLFRQETFLLQENFLRFSQRYLFREISGRAHVRDLFRMLRANLGIDALHEEVRGEVFDMVQYLDSNALRRQQSSMHRLTVVTIFGLAGSIVTGFLGMNLIAEADSSLANKLTFFGVTTLAVVALTVAAVVYSRPLTNFLERISGEDRDS